MPDYLHLDFRPRSAWWIAQLQTKARESPSEAVRVRYERWAESGLGELALALATKLEVRGRVAARLSSLLGQLHAEVDGCERLDELLEGGYVFTPSEPSLLYDICDAVDSLYFECRSAYEITGEFVRRFCSVILEQDVSEDDLRAVVEGAGHDVTWIGELREVRKLFFHETAPWIALRIEGRRPLRFQLVVMKENVHHFDDPETFITQERLAAMWDGYGDSMLALKAWLEGLLDEAA